MASLEHQSLRAALIVLYIVVWATYDVLVHASSRDKSLDNLNPAILVVIVESMKLLISAATFVAQKGLLEGWKEVRVKVTGKILIENMLVAFLYFIYNNLMILNLRYFDPTTYLLVSNTRLLMTAYAWQRFFGKPIGRTKLVAVALISLGILIKEASQLYPPKNTDAIGTYTTDLFSRSPKWKPYMAHLSLVQLQVVCAVMASLYNEAILKKRASMSPNLQNMCLYAESIALNAAAILVTSSPGNVLQTTKVTMLSSILPFASAVTLAAAGILTSLLLRYVDSITKSVAGASEAAVTAVIGSVCFGYPVTLPVVISVFLVGTGAYLYACGDAGHTICNSKKVKELVLPIRKDEAVATSRYDQRSEGKTGTGNVSTFQ